MATDIGPHAEVLAGGPSESWTCPVGDVPGLTAAIEAALAGGELNGDGAAGPCATGCSPGTRRRRRPGRTSRCTSAVLARRAAPFGGADERERGAGDGRWRRPAARPAGDAHRSRGRAGRVCGRRGISSVPTARRSNGPGSLSGGGSTGATINSPCSLSGPGRGSSALPRGTSRRRSAVRSSSPSAPARSPPTTAGSSPIRRTPPRSASPSPTTCSDRSGPVGVVWSSAP